MKGLPRRGNKPNPEFKYTLFPPFVPEMTKESAKEVWSNNILALSLEGNTRSIEITLFDHVNRYENAHKTNSDV